MNEEVRTAVEVEEEENAIVCELVAVKSKFCNLLYEIFFEL